MVDEEGLAGLSMRKLGRELGVEAMSLYVYVANKDAILDDIVELLFTEIQVPKMSGRDWDEVAHALFSAFRRVLLSHPKTVTLLASRTVRNFDALAPIELSLGNLRRAGFDRRTTIDAHRALLSFTIGYVLSEVGGLDALNTDGLGSAAHARQIFPMSQLPFLAELAPVALQRDPDEQFQLCLSMMLTGIAHCHPSTGQESNGPRCGM